MSDLDKQLGDSIVVGFLYGIQSELLADEEVEHRVAGFRHTKGYKEALNHAKLAFTEDGWYKPGGSITVRGVETITEKEWLAGKEIDTFIDAGWKDQNGSIVYTRFARFDNKLILLNGVDPLAMLDLADDTLMTGQEWYAHLEDLSECNCESRINQVCDKCQIIRPFLEAAKKAAGIE